MPFNNPLVAGEELIIPGIRSADWLESLAGWRIARDGRAQFSNLFLTGDINATHVAGDTFEVGPGGLWLPDGTEVGARLTELEKNDTSFPSPGELYRGGHFVAANASGSDQTPTDIGLIELDTGIIPKTGWYLIRVHDFLVSVTAADTNTYVRCLQRYTVTTNGTTPANPTISSTLSRYGTYVPKNTTGSYASLALNSLHWLGKGARYRFLHTYGIVGQPAGGVVQLFDNQTVSVSCIYMGYRSGYTANVGGIYGYGIKFNPGGGTETPPPTPPPVPDEPPDPVRYTYNYFPDWSRSFEGDGSTRYDDSAFCYHGQFSSTNGNQRSLIGTFRRNRTGPTLNSDLNDATVVSCKLVFNVAHSYYNAGAEFFWGTHDYSSKPSTWSGGSVQERRGSLGTRKAGGPYTVTVPASVAQDCRTGGIAFGPPSSTSRNYYGYLKGATQSGEPYLIVTFDKVPGSFAP